MPFAAQRPPNRVRAFVLCVYEPLRLARRVHLFLSARPWAARPTYASYDFRSRRSLSNGSYCPFYCSRGHASLVAAGGRRRMTVVRCQQSLFLARCLLFCPSRTARHIFSDRQSSRLRFFSHFFLSAHQTLLPLLPCRRKPCLAPAPATHAVWRRDGDDWEGRRVVRALDHLIRRISGPGARRRALLRAHGQSSPPHEQVRERARLAPRTTRHRKQVSPRV